MKYKVGSRAIEVI